jgi:hypothetical protein
MKHDELRLHIGGLVHRYQNCWSLLIQLKPNAMKYDRVKRKHDLLKARIGMLIYSTTV